MTTMWFAGGTLTLLALAIAFLASRLFTRLNGQDSEFEWLEDFSPQRYRPMERLFNDNDYHFLESQPGFQPRIAHRLRAERKKIFRAYLGEMIRDFNRLTHAGQLMVVYSTEDRSDFAREISRMRLQFYWGVAKTQLWLAAGTPDMSRLPLGGLIGALERIDAGVRAGLALPVTGM